MPGRQAFNASVRLGFWLVLSAVKMIEDKRMKKVAIIDCDMHHGNGTDDILDQLNLHSKIMNISSSYYYGAIMARLDRVPIAAQYMEALSPTDGSVITTLKEFQPDLIIYQSGADVHIDDPAGGLLDESQMFERDLRVFEIAKILNVPLAWCLAGGYQVEADGSIAKVVRFHMNTFEACNQAYLRS
jgi:acetoin utilization deacetylase AcuC-like enzyme